MLLGPIISRLFTCSNAEKNLLKKTKGACSSPISMIKIHKRVVPLQIFMETPQFSHLKTDDSFDNRIQLYDRKKGL